jgi:prefoldin subunit 5
MHDPFTLSDLEKANTVGQENLAMLERLVEFVNERLSEIETLKTEVEKLKNPNP